MNLKRLSRRVEKLLISQLLVKKGSSDGATFWKPSSRLKEPPSLFHSYQISDLLQQICLVLVHAELVCDFLGENADAHHLCPLLFSDPGVLLLQPLNALHFLGSEHFFSSTHRLLKLIYFDLQLLLLARKHLYLLAVKPVAERVVIHALVVEVIARVFVRHGASRAHLSQVIEGRDFIIFLCLAYLVVGLADAARKAGITGGPGRDKNHFGAFVVLLLERRDR